MLPMPLFYIEEEVCVWIKVKLKKKSATIIGSVRAT
jgi:hypothetical protein